MQYECINPRRKNLALKYKFSPGTLYSLCSHNSVSYSTMTWCLIITPQLIRPRFVFLRLYAGGSDRWKLSWHIFINSKFSKTKYGTYGFLMNTTELDIDQVSEVPRQSWKQEAGEKYSFPRGNKIRWKARHSKIKQ